MRLAGQAKGGFYPTPTRVVDLIARTVRATRAYNGQTVIRVLDPCCGNGDAVLRLAQQMAPTTQVPINTYGIELHKQRAENASTVLDRLLSVDLFQTSIANETFSLLFLNPPYDYDHDDGKKRTEHSFLLQCTRYLRETGVLVFIVPRHRLQTSARFLSSWYEKINYWDFPNPERDDFDQAVVIALRNANPIGNPHKESQIRDWSQTEYTEAAQIDWPDYPLYYAPTTPAGDVLFTSRTVDPIAAIQEARTKGLWANPRITDSFWPPKNSHTRPLMPLRRGHLAMLIAAGFLNNACLQDASGTRVLVKGQTTKERVLAEETEETQIYRDRLETTVTMLDLVTGQIQNVKAQAGQDAHDQPDDPPDADRQNPGEDDYQFIPPPPEFSAQVAPHPLDFVTELTHQGLPYEVTTGVQDLIPPAAVTAAIARFFQQDWGDASPAEARLNDRNHLLQSGVVIASYSHDRTEFLIHQPSAGARPRVLLTEEY